MGVFLQGDRIARVVEPLRVAPPFPLAVANEGVPIAALVEVVVAAKTIHAGDECVGCARGCVSALFRARVVGLQAAVIQNKLAAFAEPIPNQDKAIYTCTAKEKK